MGKEENIIFCSHIWEKGRRPKNEDSLAYWHMKKGTKQKVFAIICDGIGGLQEGEQASGYVVRQMVNWFMLEGYKLKNIQKAEMKVQQLAYQLHEEIKLYGKEKGIRLGTTMTLLWWENKRYFWIHFGDCRLYLIRRKKVRKLTREHCEKNGAVNQAIGVGEWKLPMVGRGKIGEKDAFLMCTDGFYRNLDEEVMASIAGRIITEENQAERMLKQVYEKKLAIGERDNISALYLGRVVQEKEKGRNRKY